MKTRFIACPSRSDSQNSPLFQAIGVISGNLTQNSQLKRLQVEMDGVKFNLLPNIGNFKAFYCLCSKIDAPLPPQRLLVYPQPIHRPSRKTKQTQISKSVKPIVKEKQPTRMNFVLCGFDLQLLAELEVNQFLISGVYQKIPNCKSPVISVYRNKSKQLLSSIERADSQNRSSALLLKAKHIPITLDNLTPYSGKNSAHFVSVKAAFDPATKTMKAIEHLIEPTTKIPKYLKKSSLKN